MTGNSRMVLRPGRQFCWLSGWTKSYRPDSWWGPWMLQVAHIASGQGRARRVDDVRAVVVLCPLAHDLHVSDADRLTSKVIGGVSYPTIDERHTMWLKRELDRENYDPEFLETVWIGKPPAPKRPPSFWMDMMFKSQGITL